MTLELVYGQSSHMQVARELAKELERNIDEGTLYLGYPVLSTADDKIDVDGLLVSESHGLIAFLFEGKRPESKSEWQEIRDRQDQLFVALETYLGRHQNLRNGRKIAVTPRTASLFSGMSGTPIEANDDTFFGELNDVGAWIAILPGLDPQYSKATQAALQRVSSIKPAKKRTGVTRNDSRGAVLKVIEAEIANLDQWQKQAAIESPAGPQRVRGLAGSGKTVVLALKAAYWHSTNPDWRIAVTFHTRSLYQQFEDLITRFTFEQTNDRPDPEHLRVIHSWGSQAKSGVYSMIAREMGVTPRDYAYAVASFGRENAFRGVCQELLSVAKERSVNPIFDAVLIDEAQDLPPEFFQLVYLFTKPPKRIVWGYDELQKLSDTAMPDTRELFGVDEHGMTRVSIENTSGQPKRDIVLSTCYRNSPWALATAHAIGIGAYRNGGIVQHFDRPSLWQDVGYQVDAGRLDFGERVTLSRRPDATPNYFRNLLRDDDALLVEEFATEVQQDEWVADQIQRNIEEDELDYDDILIVIPDVIKARSRAPRLARQLTRRGISSHLVGVTTSTDEVFRPKSIAVAHIYRAKGNEAPMVYAVDSQQAALPFNIVRRRNTLFTAITRSRAWVRVVGWGPDMETISDEIAAVRAAAYSLSFRIPSESELMELRERYRVRPEEDEEAVRRISKEFENVLREFERGGLSMEDLPPSLRTRLARLGVVLDDEKP